MNPIFPFFTKFFLFFSFLFNSSSVDSWIDLEKEPDEFVIETKRIHISAHPDAFNPSIIRHEGQNLLIFRIRDPILYSTDKMAIVSLDDDFNVNSPIYPVVFKPTSERSMAQDPRLIAIGKNLFIVYNDTLGSPQKHIRRMLVAKLTFKENAFHAEDPEMLKFFEFERANRHEKNWVPFTYHGRLFLTHSLQPHLIFRPILSENRCLTAFSTATVYNWEFGELRGGTQAFLVNDEYLAFFHSSKTMRSKQSLGKEMTHYFMGAYTFEKDPPFKIKKISKKPIVGKNFYNGETHKTWKPLRVVFPGGYIFDKKHIWIAYGRQDHEIWIVKLNKKKLLRSLTNID